MVLNLNIADEKNIKKNDLRALLADCSQALTFADSINISHVKLNADWVDNSNIYFMSNAYKIILNRSFPAVRQMIWIVPGSCFTNPVALIKLHFVLLWFQRGSIQSFTINDLFSAYHECIKFMELDKEDKAINFTSSPIVSSISSTATANKSLYELLSELAQLNKKFDLDLFRDKVETILQLMNKYSVQFDESNQSKLTLIDNATRNIVNISQLIMEVKNGNAPDKDLVVLALLFKNIELCQNKKAREIQILSVLLLVFKQEGYGRLLQIKTGEGKTMIIAVFAAWSAIMKNIKVDIATSGEVLAIRDVEEYRKFYANVGLVVNHNINIYSKVFGGRFTENIYMTSDVLYCTLYHFEGDMLHDYILNCDIAKTRQKSLLIVDEVDNMFIDGRHCATRLGDTGAEEDGLKLVRINIANRVNQFLLSHVGDLRQLEYDAMEKAVVCMVKDIINSPENSFGLSEHAKELSLLMIETYVHNARRAQTEFSENVDYVIQNKKIIPITKGTGELSQNTRWQHGLHEFLELKHNLPFGRDGLTSVYYSNWRFFAEYKGNICGLTGTLGSLHCREFLAKVYKVDSLIVPTFMQSRMNRFPTVVTTSENWAAEIVKEIAEMNSNHRPVLVILDSIAEVNEIHELLRHHELTDNFKINIYTISNDPELVHITKNVIPSQVILATNLAGRGTDFNIEERINKAGGLHVITGFLPQSQRIQFQAEGRCARAGQNGSCRMIIRDKFMGATVEFFEDLFNSFGIENVMLDKGVILTSLRDIVEQIQMEFEGLPSVNALKIKDAMFKQVCDFIDSRPEIRASEGTLEGIKEQWGIFYARLEINDEHWTEEVMWAQFVQFMDELKKKVDDKFVSVNPAQYYLMFDQLLRESGNENEALLALEKARKFANGLTFEYAFRRAIIHNNMGVINKDKRELELAKELIKDTKDCLKKNIKKKTLNLQTLQISIQTNAALQSMVSKIHHRRRIPSNSPETGAESNQINVDKFSVFEEIEDLNVTLIDDAAIEKIIVNNEQEFSTITSDTNPIIVTQRSQMFKLESFVLEELSYLEFIVHHNCKEENDDKKISFTTRVADRESPSSVPSMDRSKLPFPPNSEVRKQKNWTMAYLGFAIGALQIIGGACLTIFTSGLCAAWGVGFIIDGLLTIHKGYEMAAADNENVWELLGYVAINTLISVAAGGIANAISPFISPVLAKAMEGMSALAVRMVTSSFSHAVLTQTMAVFLKVRLNPLAQTAEKTKTFGDIVANIDKEQKNDVDPSSRPSASARDAMLKQMLEENAALELHKISQETLNAMMEKLNEPVKFLWTKIKNKILNDNDFSLLYITAVIYDDSHKDNERIEDLSTELHTTLTLPVDQKLISPHEVVQFQKFDDLSSLEIPSNSQIFDQTETIKQSLKRTIVVNYNKASFDGMIHRRLTADNATLNALTKQLSSDIKSYNEEKKLFESGATTSDPISLVNAGASLKQRTEERAKKVTFNKDVMSQYNALLLKETRFEMSSELLLLLEQKKVDEITVGQILSIIQKHNLAGPNESVDSINNYLTDLIMSSISDPSSELAQLFEKRKRVEDLFEDAFYPQLVQFLFQYMLDHLN
eukprot:gene10980-14748_t